MYNILLVDDSDIERNGLRKLLERSEYPVRLSEACDGEDAWEKIRADAPDIIFTDVKMPVMNGIELLGLVKEYDADIQTIIFSAYSDFEYTKMAIENKADNYILKPIDTDEFKRVLANAVERVDEIAASHRQEDEVIRNTVRFDPDLYVEDEAGIMSLILEAISEKNLDILNGLIDELFAKLHENKAMSMLYVKQLSLRIIKKIYEVYDGSGKKSGVFKNMDELIAMSSAEKIEVYLKKTVAYLVGRLSDGEGKKRLSKAMEIGLSRLRQRYAENISLDSIAEDVGLSGKYFSRIFKREMGIDFSKYLTDYRMKKAAQKLLETDRSIAEICREVGIPDSAYFGSVFKKYYGMTPGQWRKNREGVKTDDADGAKRGMDKK